MTSCDQGCDDGKEVAEIQEGLEPHFGECGVLRCASWRSSIQAEARETLEKGREKLEGGGRGGELERESRIWVRGRVELGELPQADKVQKIPENKREPFS